MRKLALPAALVLILVSWMALPALSDNPMPANGQEVTVTGKITCTSCNIAGRTCGKGCCEACIKAGDPPLLTDEEGNRFILLRTGGVGTPLMTKERYKMLRSKVTVTGTLVAEKGLQAIQVTKMEKK